MLGVFTLLYGLVIKIVLAQHTHDRSDLYSLLGYPDTEPSPTADYPGNDQYYQPPNGTAQVNRNPTTRVNQNPVMQSKPVAQRPTYTDQRPIMPQMVQPQSVATSQLQPQQLFQPQPVTTSQLQPQHMVQPQPVATSQLQPQQYMQPQVAVQPGLVQPVVQTQPIAQTQPFLPMQPLPQTQPGMQMQSGMKTQPIYQPQPTTQNRYVQLVAQPPITMQTQPLMQHRYMQPVVPTQQYLQSQPFIQPPHILTQPQQYLQRRPSMPAQNVMPAAATPFLQTQKQQVDKQADVKLAGRIVPTIQSNLRRHQSPHIPSAPRTNHHVIYGSRVPLFFFQHPSNIG